MKPTLAVLVTYYNEKELLTECLRSVLEQPEPPDEVLVYDDCSKLPARDYVPRDWPVKILRGETNKGPSHGRNVLLHAATTDYVHFHDSDDWFAPDWCRKVRAKLDGNDAVYTEVTSYIGDNVLAERVVGIERVVAGEDIVRFCVLNVMLVPAGTFRRELILKLGGYRTDIWQSEDYEFNTRVAASGLRYELIDEPLVKIRIRPESRSQRKVEVWTCRLQGLRTLERTLPAKYRPELSEAAATAGSTLFKLGARTEAREAFHYARELGSPEYRSYLPAIRSVARVFGPEPAEWLSLAYRAVLPEQLRRWVRRKAS